MAKDIRLAVRVAVALALAGAASCGGGSGNTSPVTPSNGAKAPTFSVLVPVLVAPSAAAQTAARMPSYYSPYTQSLNVWVYQRGPNGAPQVAMVTLSPLTPSSKNCSTTSAGTVCNIPLTLAAGTYYCTVETFSATGGHGPVLSIQEYIPLTVSSTGALTTPPWILYGVPHTITAAPTVTAASRFAAPNVTTMYGKPVTYTISVFDPSGAQIVGPGVPNWNVTASNAKFGITQPTTQSPNTFTISTTSTIPLTTTLTVTGSFLPASIIDFCRVVGANCTQNVGTLNSIDVEADDWLTFAHDYQRTGYQKQATGLSVASAPNLGLRWKVQVPNRAAINANPTVYDGNVIVVTSNPVAVYDYSAIDGTLIWSQTAIAGGSIKPATVDPAASLVFVGNRLSTSSGTEPSTLYALSLADGHIVWQSTIMGVTRSAEVVANGKIYVGSAGGDPPACYNQGVQRLDEATGAIDWTWYVNTVVNPGGGGAVWGAIGFDGTHLIFGTGNVCQANGNGQGVVPTGDGVAALDLNGNLLWTYVAWAQTGANAINLDYDTGGSVLVENAGSSTETATFLNKNGLLYTFNTSGLSSATPSAVLVRDPAANQYYGYGFYASPTSDGNVTVVGTGTYGNNWTGVSSTTRAGQYIVPSDLTADHFTPHGLRRVSSNVPGYYCLIRGFNSTGARMWSYKTTNIIAGYIALANGVAISASDSSVVALNYNGSGTLTPLWQYATTGIVDNSAAIVPSGVYAADDSGYVYAFMPPLSSS